MQKTEILIINPVSGKGRGEKLQSTIIKHAKDYYPHITVLITSEKNQAKEYIQSSAKQCSKLFVAGGDGTLNEVVRGFQTGHDFILYSIPIGSGNDFSRSAGTLNKSIQEIFQASVNPKYVLCDIGRVRLQNSDNSVLETAFLSSCGSGFDATVSKFSNRKTFLTGLPLYISSVMKALVHLNFIDVEIILDHTDYFSGEKLLVTIGNTATSGGGFKLTPHASTCDGKLDCMIAGKVTRLKILKLLPRTIFGKHLSDVNVTYKQCKEIQIRYKKPAIIHIDGEIITEQAREVRITVDEKVVRLGTV